MRNHESKDLFAAKERLKKLGKYWKLIDTPFFQPIYLSILPSFN